MLTFPVALAATIVVEVPVWTGLLRAAYRIDTRAAALLGLLVNLVTHPIFWFVVYPASSSMADEWVAMAVSEALVVVAEVAMAWWALRRLGRDGSPMLLAGIAVSANLLSIGAGMLLQI